MRKLVVSCGAAASVLLVSHVTHAHFLACEKTVNGTSYLEVSEYPTTLRYEFSISNVDTAEASDVFGAEDPTLASYGFSFDPAPPFTLGVGETVSDSFDVTLESEADCIELAAADGVEDARFDNIFVVTWESGEAMCFATVVCLPPLPPDSDVTRTPGFYKTHEDALAACLVEGPIDLGFITIDSLESALGLLWANPSVYPTGEKRSELDRARFILARHTLVASCNTTLFGTATDPADLIDQAVGALSGTDCELIKELSESVDAFNNSGTEENFPEGFEPGPATPRHASELASDPTGPSGEVCGG